MLTLSNLVPAGKKRKRVGRGGGRGGTSGRGHKGQNARSGGGVDKGFEGGQMPIYRRLPKRGFTNARFKDVVEIVSLSRLEAFEENVEITRELLIEKKVIKPRKNKLFTLKVLGGELKKPLTIVADSFSAGAQEAIEKAGGKAVTKKA